MRTLVVFLLLFSAAAFSQELNCKVSVNLDNINPSNRDQISDFQQAVSNYMNRTRFTSEDWGGNKITCGLTILVLTATSDGSFTAQVIVSSQRNIYQSDKNSLMLSINDNSWSFNYQKGQDLQSDLSTFDPIVGVLNYYAYIIIGFDEDSWTEYGGTPYFNKAINIVNLGATSNYSKGWQRVSGSYSRAALVEDLLNDKYRPFREGFYQYYYGIDIYQKNKKIGQQKIIELIKTLYDMRDKIDFSSVLLKTFFDAHSGEIAEYLKGYPDKNVFNMLIQIDPSHTSKYAAAGNSSD